MNIKRLSPSTLQLPDTTGTLYTCPASKRASVIIVLHNTNATTETVTLYWPGTAATQQRFKEDIPSNAMVMIEPKIPITLEAGETISGSSTTASMVNVEITGVEEDA
jgi:hypothetical protein